MLEDLEHIEIAIKYFQCGFMISHRSLLDTVGILSPALGKAIKKRDIEVRSMKYLIFQIHSSANNGIYTITLGDKMTMPQCTCENWGKSSMPGKHMFAVMDHIECASCVSFL